MAITITGLTAIDGNQVENDDLIVLEDINEGTTKKITFGDLTNTLLNEDSFTQNIEELLSAINVHDGGNGHNTLNANSLYYNSAYRTASYFLDYDNFTNKPVIPYDLNMLVNSTGFIRLDTSEPPARLIWESNVTDGDPETVSPQTVKIGISTLNIPENTATNDDGSLVGPLYYTDQRVEDFFDERFFEYYNRFTSTFDDGNVRDSLFDVEATVTDVNFDSNDSQGKVLRVSDPNVFDNFSVGQTLRIYGGDIQQSVIESLSSTLALDVKGFAESSSVSGHQTTISYKVCEFNVSTGQVSPAGNTRTVQIATPSEYYNVSSGTYRIDSVYDAFSPDAFIRLQFQGVPAGHGLLVYRQTPNTNNQYILTAVLGTKETSTGQWIDYYNFDWVTWSGKNEADNTYPSTVVHFPHTAPFVSKRGWADKTIASKEIVSGNMILTLDDVVFISSDSQTVTIAHNDTQKIRTAITQNKSIDKKSVVLNAKTYVSAALTLPDNFGITGTPYITKIVKLPWSGGDSGISSSKMVKSQEGSGASNISIVGIDFDGNALHQFQFPDSTDESRNYCIDLGVNTDGPLVDKVRIRNVIGGGVYADRPIDMRFVSSEVLNSGLNDRDSYSPLYAYGGQKTTITSNRFENFGGSVDVSNTDKGILSDNLINNVGSGATVYGSKFFISSQNVLIGPANEFLPTPDTLNSEFDLINIDLNEAFSAGPDGPGKLVGPYVYQENGEIYDLTQTDGSISELTYDVHYIEKLPNGGEQFWTPSYAKQIVLIPNESVVKSRGEFGFRIPYEADNPDTEAGVYDIKHRSGTNSYTSLTQDTINWNNIADDILAKATSSPLDQAIDDFLTTEVLGNPRADITEEGSITSADALRITYYSGGPQSASYSNLTSAEIFRIQKFWENALLDDYKKDSPTFSSTVLNRYINPGNPNHKGIGWSAKYRNEVAMGVVNNATNDDLANGFYKIRVLNIKRGITEGSKVKLVSHGSAADGLIGTVTDINTVENSNDNTTTTLITIKYTDANGDGINLAGGQGIDGNGTINIIDTFTLAQGRIL